MKTPIENKRDISANTCINDKAFLRHVFLLIRPQILNQKLLQRISLIVSTGTGSGCGSAGTKGTVSAIVGNTGSVIGSVTGEGSVS